MQENLFIVILLGYLTSLLFYFVSFEMQREGASLWGRRAAAASLTLHAAYLAALYAGRGEFMVRGVAEAFSIGAFLMLLASLVLEIRFGAMFLMLFSLPIALFFNLLSLLLSPKTAPLGPAQSFLWHWLHLGFILIGFSGIILAVAGALMYLLQSYQLKSKHLGRAFLKLPALALLDRLHFIALSWGVILFSLGILSGVFWAQSIQELSGAMKDPKVILSFVTCLLYWAILGFRFSTLRRGHKIAVGTVLVFALLFATMLSSLYCPAGIHKGF